MMDQDIRKNVDDYIIYEDVKKITKESYRRILEKYIEYVENLSRPPTRKDIIAYREHLVETHNERTAQKNIVVIRKYYAWLYAEGRGENIAINIKGVKIPNTHSKLAFTVNQAKSLVDYAFFRSTQSMTGLRNLAITVLMLTTGLRTIEVARADIKDISERDDVKLIFIQGKGRDSKDEYVKLTEEAYSLITDYLAKRKDNYKPLFINHGNNSLHKRMATDTISNFLKDYIKDIGLHDNKYTAHSLRHTTATLGFKAGATIEQISTLLRHKNLNTTLTYVNDISRAEDNVEGLVNDAVVKEIYNKRKGIT